MNDTITISWSVDDILSVVEEGENITRDEARMLLHRIARSHDSCLGINWDVVKTVISDYIRDREVCEQRKKVKAFEVVSTNTLTATIPEYLIRNALRYSHTTDEDCTRMDEELDTFIEGHLCEFDEDFNAAMMWERMQQMASAMMDFSREVADAYYQP